ncbi:MAG: hypothetical protein QXL85_08485 [Candidatus Bathyarchaeia archaeon]
MVKRKRHSFSWRRHFRGKKPYRHFNKDRGRRGLLTSLKIWLPVFCPVYLILSYFEALAPMKFYGQVPLAVRFFLYLFTVFVASLTGYKVFLKLDYEPRTERGIFTLRLLSGGILVASFLLLLFSISSIFVASLLKSVANELLAVFSITFSAALLLLSAYLTFKFMRRSGVIVYVR